MKLTSKKVKEYMEWRTDEELRHCPNAVAEACNEMMRKFNNEFNYVELSMYDFIMGCTIMCEMNRFINDKYVKDLRKGLDWFRKYNPKAYMVLLD